MRSRRVTASRNNIHVGDLVGVSNSTSVMSFRVTGILSAGGSEDNAIVAPIAAAEKLAGHAGKYRRLMVSAVVKPDDDFDRRDHSKFTPEEYERWYCSAYIGSISLQIEQALPGVEARAVRQVAEGEGKILGRISVLLWIVTLAALIAAGLAVGSTAATSVLERQKEVGLMKALGASNSLVGAFFIGEQLLLALFGGGLGYAIGVLLARWLSITVFGVSSPARMIMLPVTLGLAIIVAVAGSIFPLRRASRFDPAPILRGE
jgi:putative ABC transport system permease protein